MTELPLAVYGIDHHRTPVAVRERMAIGQDDLAGLLQAVAGLPGCTEALCLSTCNRMELYLAGTLDPAALIGLLAERQGLEAAVLERQGYWHHGRNCVRHLFRVAASLESLVVGEYQIVHQIKTAYDIAHGAGLTGPLLNPLFQRALGVAKEVRNNTAIGQHKLSVASVAVDLARHIYGDLGPARLLVIGAGEIAELAVKYLLSAGVRELAIINRTQERALALAAVQPAKVYEWADLRRALAEHDIVVASTSAPHAVVSEADVREALRHRRTPLMFIDLAVPRDIDDQAARLEDVYLYNIDHLEQAVAANRALRGEEVASATALVDSLVGTYLDTRGSDQAALFAEVAGFFQDIIAAEEVRLAGKLGVSDTRELRYGLERVGNKLQHQLLRYLREHPGDARVEEVVRTILGLGDRG